MANGKVVKSTESQKPLIPGFGVAGQVMCPFSFMAPKQCMKQGCEMWVELTYGKRKVGRCALAWNAILMPELRQEIEKLRLQLQTINPEGEPKKEAPPK